MQFLRTQFRTLCARSNLLASYSSEFHTQTCRFFQFKAIPTTDFFHKGKKAEMWEKQNEKEYEIQQPGEEPRKAEINYCKDDIPVSWKNLWYIAKLVEGMSVDEALKQLSFVPKKGSYYVKDAIKEAQALAVTEHNVEFKSNLWIAHSYPWKEKYVFRGIQRKVRRGPKKLRNMRCYYFLKLIEGSPPPNYKHDPTGEELLENHMQRMRQRKIIGTI